MKEMGGEECELDAPKKKKKDGKRQKKVYWAKDFLPLFA